MFTLNTDLLIIDLEATAGTDDKGRQTNNYIIDIGAVLVDKNLNTVSSFSSLVKPEEEITPFITGLTGIDNDMVRDEKLFPEVISQFEEWVLKETGRSNMKKVRLCAWGNYFDIPLLRSLYNKYDREFPFSGTAFDIKTMALMWMSLSGRKTDKLQVSQVAKTMNIIPDGKLHRAITDAKTEAAILLKVWKDLQGVFMPQKDGKPYTHFTLTESC